MSNNDIVLSEIQKLKDAGISNSAIEKICGLSNGMIGKILSGNYVITEKTKNKILNRPQETKVTPEPQKELERLKSVSGQTDMFVPNQNGLDVLAKYMLDNGIIYTDLIEAYESQKKAINETLKAKEPEFKPSDNLAKEVITGIKNETESQRLYRWGWNISEFNAYYETVIPRLYKPSQFHSIIMEENDNIELLKIGAEIKKASHINSDAFLILIRDIVNKLNQSL